MDYYTQWSTRGYVHGAGCSRWVQLQTSLSMSPAIEQQCQRIQEKDIISRSEFYEKCDAQQLPGDLPLTITDLTETWPSCPTHDEDATTSQRWTLDHLLTRFAHASFRLEDFTHGKEISFLQYYIYLLVTRDDSPFQLYDR